MRFLTGRVTSKQIANLTWEGGDDSVSLKQIMTIAIGQCMVLQNAIAANSHPEAITSLSTKGKAFIITCCAK